MPQKDTHKAVINLEESERIQQRRKGINYLFVIAIDAYEYCPKLYNCINDANGLIKVLTEKYEFEPANIQTLFNEAATEGNIFNEFRTLIKKITAEDNVIIYFSGHGEYDEVFEEGYWIPVNAQLGAHEDFIPNSKIKNILEAIKAKHIFLIADSCFSGSLFTQFKSASVAERLENDPSRWGLTAGRNEVVSDGQVGDHSPFSDSLLYHLKESKVPIGVATLCNRVVENVVAAADQTPRGEPLKVRGHRGGQFFFHPRGYEQDNGETQSGNGSILYQIPDKMNLGEDSKCVVRIAFNTTILRKELDISDDTTIKSIKVSPVMEVELLDPLTTENFQIRAINETEQIIDKQDFTQWLFYVKAKKEGKFPLFLKVTVIELLYGKERKKEIVLEETVHVVTQLSEPLVECFKDAGYAFSFSSGEIKGLGGQMPSAPQIIKEPTLERFQPPKAKPAPSVPNAAPVKIPTTKREIPRNSYKILGGLAAVLLFLVMGNSLFTTYLDSTPKMTTPAEVREPTPEPNAPEVTIPMTQSEEEKGLSDRKLRKERNPNGNGKMGFRDATTKELVIDYNYDMVMPFNGPSTFVKQGNKWALINKAGNYLVTFRIKQPGRFVNGYAEIIPEGRNKVIKINYAGEVKIKDAFYKLEDVLDRKSN